MGVDKTLSELWHLRGNTDVVSFEELREEASTTAFMAIGTIKRLLWEIEQKDKLIEALEQYAGLKGEQVDNVNQSRNDVKPD